jgi:serine/threonine-protein kinase HipA
MDCGAWEWVTHQLAREAGIDVSESHARKLRSDHHTFLTRRFDRTPDGKRVHFASAMTLLGRGDGDGADTGASYLELAECLERHGSNPSRDLQQLWRRIVFSICVSNSDDHLRNHGFLLGQKGWALSPAYDVNPNPGATGLHLNIDDSSNALDLRLACEVAELFRVTPSGAKATVDRVVKVVSQWRSRATRIGIPRGEQEYMEPAFRAALG